jgi:glycosyltransferase involved in cell wall biosynthesis
MGKQLPASLTIVQYTADEWHHVCPVLRVVGPAQMAGWSLIHGNEWVNGQLTADPELVRQADIVLIQRDFPRYAEVYDEVVARARAHSRPLVYEIDDLLMELPKTHPDYEHYTSVRAAILRAVVQADAVTCSTPALRDYLYPYNPSIWVIPNYLNDHLWTLRPLSEQDNRPEERPLVIGYLGAHSHQPDLEMVLPALEYILERYEEQILLRLWGIVPPVSLKEWRNVEWLDPGLVDYGRFASYFLAQECDIFLAPLVDNLFNRCKSPLKYLEYSALGVPGIFSDLPPYASVVVHGKNGFLANTIEEWKRFLIQLIENPQLRQKMGEAAQDTLRKDWLLSDHIHVWKETFANIYTSSPNQLRSRVSLPAVEKLYQWNREDHALIRAQKEKINLLINDFVTKERIIQSQNTQLTEKERLLMELHNHITAIHQSTGWKMLEALYRVRLRLIPRHSRREQWMYIILQSLRILKNEGTKPMFKRLIQMARGRTFQPVLETVHAQSFISSQFLPAERCPDPAISLILVQDESPSSPEIDALLHWCERQTLHSFEVVAWQKKDRLARDLNSGVVWAANDVPSLIKGLKGRYLCLVSPDLLQQNPAYLEANLVALESESLLFTINALGQASWTTRLLGLNRLPGDISRPLFRLVVRKEFVTNDYSIDLGAWLAKTDGGPRVVGKVIRHTSSVIERGTEFPLETPLIGEADLILQGNTILARLKKDISWAQASHPIKPILQVMPIKKELSEQPTIIMAQTFLAVGGAEQVALNMMDGLRKEIRFVVVSLEEHDPALGTTAEAFRRITPYVYTMPEYVSPHLYYEFLEYLIERFKPQTFYIANGASWLYDAIARLKQQNPHLRLVNQVYDHQAGWINRYDFGVVLSIDAHIALNRRIYEAYLNRGVHPTRIYLIQNGVDGRKFNPSDYPQERCRDIKEKIGLPPNKKIITFISRFHPQKRPLDFIELARQSASDSSLHFLMVGDGPLASTVENKIHSLGLKNLRRLSFYSPSSDIFAISDVIVLPSEYEGMPMVILEALAMGKPLVVTDVGNNREVLDITKGGIVVPRIGDIAAIKEGIRQVLSNPPDPKQLRETVLAHYSLERMCINYRLALLGE